MKRKELFKVNSIKLELVVPLISAFLVATIIITSVVLYHSKKNGRGSDGSVKKSNGVYHRNES
jgi:hypothetical protein